MSKVASINQKHAENNIFDQNYQIALVQNRYS